MWMSASAPRPTTLRAPCARGKSRCWPATSVTTSCAPGAAGGAASGRGSTTVASCSARLGSRRSSTRSSVAASDLERFLGHQQQLAYGLVAAQRGVRLAELAVEPAAGDGHDLRVPPRNEARLDHDVAARVAAEHVALVRAQPMARAARRPLDREDALIHRLSLGCHARAGLSIERPAPLAAVEY